MIRTMLVTLALTGLVAGTAGNCENGGSVYKAKVCVDKAHPVKDLLGDKTYTRVKDVQCENGTAGRAWRYFGGGIVIEKVGEMVPASGGSFTKPASKYQLVRIPEEGGWSANDVANQ